MLCDYWWSRSAAFDIVKMSSGFTSCHDIIQVMSSSMTADQSRWWICAHILKNLKWRVLLFSVVRYFFTIKGFKMSCSSSNSPIIFQRTPVKVDSRLKWNADESEFVAHFSCHILLFAPAGGTEGCCVPGDGGAGQTGGDGQHETSLPAAVVSLKLVLTFSSSFRTKLLWSTKTWRNVSTLKTVSFPLYALCFLAGRKFPWKLSRRLLTGVVAVHMCLHRVELWCHRRVFFEFSLTQWLHVCCSNSPIYFIFT